jgi:signal transduction histidine kinase
MVSKKESIEDLIKTARSKLEEALDNLEDLPGLDKHGLGIAAHALGNYLTVIEGTIELLKVSLKDKSDPQIETWLDGISHTTNLMMHTTNQLIRSSAITGPQLISEEIDILLLTERICAFYQNRAKRKKLTIRTEFKKSNLHVSADRVALAAVFDNLFSNAIKYSRPGHEIIVSLTEIEGNVHWKIKDAGPGILEEEVEHLFKEGVKLSSMPTANENSSGYGLAIAKYFVTEMGGQIWYEPNPDGGSIFVVSMPVIE